MTAHLPVLIVVIPLGAAVLVPLASLLSIALARSVTLLALAGVSLIAAAALSHVLSEGNWHYELGGWEPPWGIEYVIDPLSGGMCLLVAGIAGGNPNQIGLGSVAWANWTVAGEARVSKWIRPTAYCTSS